jgi:hypothetical protein
MLLTTLLTASCAGIGSQEASGVLAITPQYQWAGPFSEDLAAVQIDDLVGYINKEGKLVIKPQFHYGFEFIDGYALVTRTSETEWYDDEFNFIGEYELIDTSGRTIKKFGKEVYVYSHYLAHESEEPATYVVEYSDLCAYVDAKGKSLFSAKFKSCGAFVSKLAPVEDIDTGKTGYINPDGEWVIQPTFERAEEFSDGYAVASISRGSDDFISGYINMKGEWVINPQFWLAGAFSDGLARVVDCDGCDTGGASYGNHGFIDKDGKFVIEKKYKSYSTKYFFDQDFHEGFTVEFLRGGWTFIDRNEVPISSERFENVSGFQNGYALVQLQTKWGYINLDGKIAVSPQFEDAAPFSEGYAAVKIAGKWGYIN